MTGIVVRRCLVSLPFLERMKKEPGTALHVRNPRYLFPVSLGGPDGHVVTGGFTCWCQSLRTWWGAFVLSGRKSQTPFSSSISSRFRLAILVNHPVGLMPGAVPGVDEEGSIAVLHFPWNALGFFGITHLCSTSPYATH
ncbi:hypothetical protein OAG11_05945 [Verrucomicrobia bacterium]|nr:hypothetical protein [Verrucomicrobiota bacterium]